MLAERLEIVMTGLSDPLSFDQVTHLLDTVGVQPNYPVGEYGRIAFAGSGSLREYIRYQKGSEEFTVSTLRGLPESGPVREFLSCGGSDLSRGLPSLLVATEVYRKAIESEFVD